MSDDPNINLTENAAREGGTAPAAASPPLEIVHGAARFDPGAEAEAAQPQAQSAPSKQPQEHLARKPAGESWLMTIQSLLGTIVIALFVITFAAQAFQIPSESMENTLLVGDYLLVDKVQFARGGIWNAVEPYVPIKRGDIIVFHYPVDPTQHFVKRVIAVPGDHVRLSSKRVWVNGRLLNDRAYAVYRPGSDAFRDNFPTGAMPSWMGTQWMAELRQHVQGEELVVPAGDYFVLGDNRDNSDDSRYWGFVPRENIVGRPLLIYFSLAQTPLFSRPRYEDGKLAVFGVMLQHFWQDIRWHRTLRLVY